jgi:hypothetical protein
MRTPEFPAVVDVMRTHPMAIGGRFSSAFRREIEV